MGEGPLIDISLTRDLVMIRLWCDGNLDCFKQSFLFMILERKRMGWETNGIHLKIDNVEMPNKHEVSLGSCVFFFS